MGTSPAVAPGILTLVTARTVFWSLAGAYATEIAFVSAGTEQCQRGCLG